MTYDPETDARYVYLMSQDTALDHTDEIDFWRIVDFDDVGHAIGVEFLAASHGIDLDGVPKAGRFAEAIGSLHQLTPA
ncbi:MAG: DUF2283 domain-containing protein [Dehalococcoidia bacterium]|nr:DUF2283 domain-containing protein [Dehalococcoidia bacterium]